MSLDNSWLVRDDRLRSGIVFFPRSFSELLAGVRASGAFQLNASVRFTAPVPGPAALMAARSNPDSRVTAGEASGMPSGPTNTVVPLNMMKYFSLQLLATSTTGKTWYLTAALRPLEAGKIYTVCLLGEGTEGGAELRFADIICYYFPM